MFEFLSIFKFLHIPLFLCAWSSDLARTKNWGNEILTDADLEGQLDLIIAWVMACMNSSTGHTHVATANKGPKIPINSGLTITSQAQGDIIYASASNAWARLAAGNAEDFLLSGGAGANPSWKGIDDFTEKTTLVANDLFVIEDSAASNAKKKVKASNISVMTTLTSGALVANTIQTLAHGLGAMPTVVQVSLVCVTTDQGWAVDDEIYEWLGSATADGIVVGIDATNITVIPMTNIYIANKTTASATVIVLAKWKIRVRCRL